MNTDESDYAPSARQSYSSVFICGYPCSSVSPFLACFLRPVSAALRRGRDVDAEALFRELLQGAIGAHGVDDLLHLGGELGIALVDGDRDRLVEQRLADDLHGLAVLDVILGGQDADDHAVEPGAVAE